MTRRNKRDDTKETHNGDGDENRQGGGGKRRERESHDYVTQKVWPKDSHAYWQVDECAKAGATENQTSSFSSRRAAQ